MLNTLEQTPPVCNEMYMFGHWVCGESWRHERSLTHHPSPQVGIWCPTLLCVYLGVCLGWGVGTSFLLFLHLFFGGVLCTCVSMYMKNMDILIQPQRRLEILVALLIHVLLHV